MLRETALRIQQQCHQFLTAAFIPHHDYQPASPHVLRDFLDGFQGGEIQVTHANVIGLLQLCDEFNGARLPNPGPRDDEEPALAELQVLVGRLVQATAQLSDECRMWRACVPRLLDSVILTEFPAILDEFVHERWTLLWRSSRDGCTAQAFHARCDGRARTLTLVRDADRFIFGGYTPVPWESRVHNGIFGVANNCYAADETCTSFIFTIKNPHHFPPRKFPLMNTERRFATYCCRSRGPTFGRNKEMEVLFGGPNAGRTCGFGNAYRNDTDRDGRTFLTGKDTYTIGEIEVFALSN
jgi:hypothetical protein